MDGKLKENAGSHISAIFNHLSYSLLVKHLSTHLDLGVSLSTPWAA